MASGKVVNPLDLKPEDVLLHDIAHHLGNTCRFSGGTDPFYSVAEHSVRVTRWVRQQLGSIEDQRWALVHDASEAYLVDLPKPLKSDPAFGRAFRRVEASIEKIVAEKFSLPGKIPSIVHDGDKCLYAAEVRDLMPPSTQWKEWEIGEELQALVPIHEIKPWGSAKSRRKFLIEFEKLFTLG